MKNDFLRSMLMLLTGSVVAQLLGVVSTPIKTRLFSVEDIGLFTYATTLMGIFTPLLLGQYDAVVVMAKRHVYAVIKVCIFLCIATTIMFTLGVTAYFCSIGTFYHNVALVVCMPFFLLITGLINILSAYNNRCREYKLLATVNIQRSLVNLVGIVLFGAFGTGYIGLLFVTVVSQLAAVRKQAQSLKGHFQEIIAAKHKIMWLMAKKYWQQPVFSMPGTFVNGLSYSLIAICVKDLYDFATLGYYSMSMTLLGLPLGLISGNVGKVFFEEASREKNETGCFINAFVKTTKYLIIGTVPIFIAIYFFAPWGCEFFLGKGWNVAGDYIRYLLPMFAVRFVVSPISLAVIISQRQYYNIILQSIFLIAVGMCYYRASNWANDLESFLLMINWSFAAIYMLFGSICWRLAKHRSMSR